MVAQLIELVAQHGYLLVLGAVLLYLLLDGTVDVHYYRRPHTGRPHRPR